MIMLALAVAVGAWLALTALGASFAGSRASNAAVVTVRNATQPGAALPLRYKDRITNLAELEGLEWMTLQFMSCDARAQAITINARGGTQAATGQGLDHWSADEIAAWRADPKGLLISARVAGDCGWKVGQPVELPSLFGNVPLAFTIHGISNGMRSIATAHFEYINRIAPVFGADHVIGFHAHAADAQAAERLAERIENAFQHDDPAVAAHTDTLAQGAASRFGKIEYLLALVTASILAGAGFVMIGGLAHAVIERRALFATHVALGFRHGVLACAFVIEALVLALMGAALGAALAAGAMHVFRAPVGATLLFSADFRVPAWAWWALPIWLGALAAAALAWPLTYLRRVRATDTRGA